MSCVGVVCSVLTRLEGLMKDITRFGSGILVLSCVYSLSARGGTSFFEDFEAQPVTTPGTKMQSPPIGEPYYYNAGTSVAAVNVVTPPLPVIGTKSLETYRTGSISPDVGGISLDNTLVDGRTLQVQWSHELANGTGHNGNAPMQNSIGYTNGSVGQMAFIIITDVSPHSGEYA